MDVETIGVFHHCGGSDKKVVHFDHLKHWGKKMLIRGR